jgi:hypothetical protein
MRVVRRLTAPETCLGSEIASIDQLIGRFFAAFDNRDARCPTIESFDSLFAAKAVVAAHSSTAVSICTVEEFARPRIDLLSSGRLVNFSEWETHAENTVLGSLAVRRSKYSKSGQLDGRPYAGSGTKFFQLALVDHAWRIVALSWIDDANHGAQLNR